VVFPFAMNYFDVDFQITGRVKLFFAHLTLTRFDVFMKHFYVTMHVTFLAVLFVANVAPEIFHLFVNSSDVSFKMGASQKRFQT
jgi:hypothetical protein